MRLSILIIIIFFFFFILGLSSATTVLAGTLACVDGRLHVGFADFTTLTIAAPTAPCDMRFYRLRLEQITFPAMTGPHNISFEEIECIALRGRDCILFAGDVNLLGQGALFFQNITRTTGLAQAATVATIHFVQPLSNVRRLTIDHINHEGGYVSVNHRGDNTNVVLFDRLVSNVIGPLSITNVRQHMSQAKAWYSAVYTLSFIGGVSNVPYIYIANVTVDCAYLSGEYCNWNWGFLFARLEFIRFGAISNVGVILLRNTSVYVWDLVGKGYFTRATFVRMTSTVSGLGMLDIDTVTFLAFNSLTWRSIEMHTLRIEGAASNIGAINVRRLNTSWSLNVIVYTNSPIWANQIQFFSTATNIGSIVIEHSHVEVRARAQQQAAHVGLIWFAQAATGVKNIELRHVDFVVHEIYSTLSSCMVRVLQSETNLLNVESIVMSHLTLRVDWVVSPASSASAIGIWNPLHSTFSSAAGAPRSVAISDTHIELGWLDDATTLPKVSFLTAWILSGAQGDERISVIDSSIVSVAYQTAAPAGASKLLCTTIRCGFVHILSGGYLEGNLSIVRSNFDTVMPAFFGSFIAAYDNVFAGANGPASVTLDRCGGTGDVLLGLPATLSTLSGAKFDIICPRWLGTMTGAFVSLYGATTTTNVTLCKSRTATLFSRTRTLSRSKPLTGTVTSSASTTRSRTAVLTQSRSWYSSSRNATRTPSDAETLSSSESGVVTRTRSRIDTGSAGASASRSLAETESPDGTETPGSPSKDGLTQTESGEYTKSVAILVPSTWAPGAPTPAPPAVTEMPTLLPVATFENLPPHPVPEYTLGTTTGAAPGAAPAASVVTTTGPGGVTPPPPLGGRVSVSVIFL